MMHHTGSFFGSCIPRQVMTLAAGNWRRLNACTRIHRVILAILYISKRDPILRDQFFSTSAIHYQHMKVTIILNYRISDSY